jgi:hypothetical protein
MAKKSARVTIPKIPSVPGIPSVPKIPSMPGVGMPSMPGGLPLGDILTSFAPLLISSTITVLIAYNTSNWSLWVKWLVFLFILFAKLFPASPFQFLRTGFPSNIPMYILMIYIFYDYLEFNKSKCKKKKK